MLGEWWAEGKKVDRSKYTTNSHCGLRLHTSTSGLYSLLLLLALGSTLGSAPFHAKTRRARSCRDGDGDGDDELV